MQTCCPGAGHAKGVKSTVFVGECHAQLIRQESKIVFERAHRRAIIHDEQRSYGGKFGRRPPLWAKPISRRRWPSELAEDFGARRSPTAPACPR